MLVQVTLTWKKPRETGGNSIFEYHYQQSNNGGNTWPAEGEEMKVTCWSGTCSLVITDLARWVVCVPRAYV